MNAFEKEIDGVTITDSYENTEELLKKFPVEYPTRIPTDGGKKIENRLLTGFDNWNRGIDGWKAWGSILYTRDSIYNVHGARLTLGQYQTAMGVMLKQVDIKMGAFHNIIINGDWTAIRYDISTNGKPGTVMEFVHFKDYGPDLGSRVLEGWGGPRDASYHGLCRIMTDDQKKEQKKKDEELISYVIPETDNLVQKYPVMNPTEPVGANADAMKLRILKLFDAWNQGETAFEQSLDCFFTGDVLIQLPGLRKLTLEEYKKEVTSFCKETRREKKYFDSILISDAWAALHFRYVDTDKASGKQAVGDGMHFLHFNSEGNIDQVYISEPVTGDAAKAGVVPVSAKKKLDEKERTALTRRLAESYIAAYDKKAVKDGATYDDWVFASDATYWSPYFGNEMIDLSVNPMSVADAATFEAKSYSVEFKDWGPLDFECFPTPDGVAWKSHFGGHRRRDNVLMDFFAYSFLHINEYGEITHWETHVNPDYNDFLDVAIGAHGPFKNGAHEYMAAVVKKLESAGIDLKSLQH